MSTRQQEGGLRLAVFTRGLRTGLTVAALSCLLLGVGTGSVLAEEASQNGLFANRAPITPSPYHVLPTTPAEERPDEATRGEIENKFIRTIVFEDGKFCIGTTGGDPANDQDHDKRLVFGYPNRSTSQTMIVVDDHETFFHADSTAYYNDRAVAWMDIDEYGITVVQRLSFVKSSTGRYDTLKIAYEVSNNDGNPHNVGVRIMLDTMIASNDDARFRLSDKGVITTCQTYFGANIPQTYQAYDNLDDPTMMAVGYLVAAGERRPDWVQFCNWREIKDAHWNQSFEDGADLGDSAVAVTFDKTRVAGGQSLDVDTYYGVGNGSSNPALEQGADEGGTGGTGRLGWGSAPDDADKPEEADEPDAPNDSDEQEVGIGRLLPFFGGR